MTQYKHRDCEHCRHAPNATIKEEMVELRGKLAETTKLLEGAKKKHGNNFLIRSIEGFVRLMSRVVEKKYAELPPGKQNELFLTSGEEPPK